MVNAFTTVKDIAPTLLDFAGISHPGTQYKGRSVQPMQGESMRALLNMQSSQVHPDDYVMGWELFGKRAIRQGDWKLVLQPAPYGTDDWQLYNLLSDPAEKIDVSKKFALKLQHMKRLWEQYARQNNVIIPDSVTGY